MKKIITCAIFVAFIGSAQAATISWNAAFATNDNAVSTTYNLVEAYNFGDANEADSPTINTVTFTAAPDTSANQSIGKLSTQWDWSRADGSRYGGNNYGGIEVSSVTLSNMLSSTWTDDASGSFDETTFTLNDLNVGWDYEVQLFFSNDNNLDVITAVDITTTADVDGTGGPHVFTGTFKADAATQIFDVRAYVGATDAQTEQNISAYQLRAIPEPATIGLLGLGALLTMFIRRYRRV